MENFEQKNNDSDDLGDSCDPDDDNDHAIDSKDCDPLDRSRYQYETYYLDSDKDGYGSSTSISRCSSELMITEDQLRYVRNNDDPIDTNALIKPDDTDGDKHANTNDCASDDPTKWENKTVFLDVDNDGVTTGNALNECLGNNLTGYQEAKSVTEDNCPNHNNAMQSDNDLDGIGDTCDSNDDNDARDDNLDCASNDSTKWENKTVFLDADNDGVTTGNSLIVCLGSNLTGYQETKSSEYDNCPNNSNTNQINTDGDAQGNVCDSDDDGDGATDADDCSSLDDSISEEQTYYRDFDSDSYGDPNESISICSHTPQTGYVVNSSDPNDRNFLATPDDLEGDGVANSDDNCPHEHNQSQINTDNDTEGDACDLDDDNDTIIDIYDNCPLLASPNQSDVDLDGKGDICDDDDQDGVLDIDDNCLLIFNPDQENWDKTGVGDACENPTYTCNNDICEIVRGENEQNCPNDCGPKLWKNIELSGVINVSDCSYSCNSGYSLADSYPSTCSVAVKTRPEECVIPSCTISISKHPSSQRCNCIYYEYLNGYLCETCSCSGSCVKSKDLFASDKICDETGRTIDKDPDRDGIEQEDNCPGAYNPLQNDMDKDGFGDACDEETDGDGILNSIDNDDDNDGLLDANDNCSLTPNEKQEDLDKDGIGDPCDQDDDNDSISDIKDNCPIISNTDQEDLDFDNIGNVCDDDIDGDGLLNDEDNCHLISNINQDDLDFDNIGDVCDDDIDGDDHINTSDNCPIVSNSSQEDMDNDGIGDICDDDIDGDDHINTSDNCPIVSNSSQEDMDNDGIGDVCDDNIDGDDHINTSDNCPIVSNSSQEDMDNDGIGDVCDDDIDGDNIKSSVDCNDYDNKINACLKPILSENTRYKYSNYNFFGKSVSVGDKYIAIGVPGGAPCNDYSCQLKYDQKGFIRVLKKINNNYYFYFNIASEYLPAPLYYGHSVAVTDKYILTGFPNSSNTKSASGNVRICQVRDANKDCTSVKNLVPSLEVENEFFGDKIITNENYIVVGTSGNAINPVYVFDYSFNNDTMMISEIFTAEQKAKLIPAIPKNDNNFGVSISLSENFIFVGAPNNSNEEGEVYVYKNTLGQWENTQIIEGGGGPDFGKNIASTNDFLFVGLSQAGNNNSGKIMVYKFNTLNWEFVQELIPTDSNDGQYFGKNISARGDILIATTGRSSAYVYRYNGSDWIQEKKIKDSNDESFGDRISTSGNYSIIAAPYDDTKSVDSGIIYLYQH